MTRPYTDLVVEIMERLGRRASPDEIAKALGWPGRGGCIRVGHILARLIDEGRIKRTRQRVLYELPDNVPNS
jgi:hypothetical protein